jgi:hypothetical protein
MRRDKTEKQRKVELQLENVRRSQWKYHLLEGVIRRASVPLLVQPSRGRSYELIASGVLINIVGHVFLFTAGHSLEALKGRAIFVPVRDGRILEIGGAGRISPTLDAGILHLEMPDLTPFIDVALPGGTIFAQPNVLEDRLVLYGYPARNFKRNGKVVACDPGLYEMKGKSEATYKRFGCDPLDHILLDWPKKSFGPHGVVHSHSLAAMSGCGVWFSPLITSRNWWDYSSSRDDVTPCSSRPMSASIFAWFGRVILIS